MSIHGSSLVPEGETTGFTWHSHETGGMADLGTLTRREILPRADDDGGGDGGGGDGGDGGGSDHSNGGAGSDGGDGNDNNNNGGTGSDDDPGSAGNDDGNSDNNGNTDDGDPSGGYQAVDQDASYQMPSDPSEQPTVQQSSGSFAGDFEEAQSLGNATIGDQSFGAYTQGGVIASTPTSITLTGAIVAFDGNQRLGFYPSNDVDSITVSIDQSTRTITAVQNKTTPT